MRQEKNRVRRRGFFLFGSFSFFKTGCGNVEKSTGRPSPGYEYSPRPCDGYPETFEPGRGPEKGCILRCCPSRTRL